jgi:microcompartment protein CcmK/EutM
VAVDKYGAGPGQVVMLNSDGKGAREYIGNEKSPVRYWVAGIVDDLK